VEKAAVVKLGRNNADGACEGGMALADDIGMLYLVYLFMIWFMMLIADKAPLSKTRTKAAR
jgi:hypothetical protein